MAGVSSSPATWLLWVVRTPDGVVVPALVEKRRVVTTHVVLDCVSVDGRLGYCAAWPLIIGGNKVDDRSSTSL